MAIPSYITVILDKDAREMRGRKRGGGGSWSRSLRGTPEADARMGISPEIRKRNKNETPGKFEYRIDIVGCTRDIVSVRSHQIAHICTEIVHIRGLVSLC